MIMFLSARSAFLGKLDYLNNKLKNDITIKLVGIDLRIK